MENDVAAAPEVPIVADVLPSFSPGPKRLRISPKRAGLPDALCAGDQRITGFFKQPGWRCGGVGGTACEAGVQQVPA